MCSHLWQKQARSITLLAADPIVSMPKNFENFRYLFIKCRNSQVSPHPSVNTATDCHHHGIKSYYTGSQCQTGCSYVHLLPLKLQQSTFTPLVRSLSSEARIHNH